MQSLFSTIAGATVRWHDLPGVGIPVVFIHGLGCASSYEYPRIAAAPAACCPRRGTLHVVGKPLRAGRRFGPGFYKERWLR